MAQSQLKNLFLTKKNPIAKDLSDGRYRQRVVQDKTKYTRKKKHERKNV